jgi:hemerythrin-like domain-containing protein
MSETMTLLREEHRNIAKLVALLEEQARIFEGGEQVPDFDVIRDILDYCANHSDRYHHPMEDVVFRRLVEREPSCGQAVEGLLAEHHDLTELTRRTLEAVGEVAVQQQIPREQVVHLIRQYADTLRRHMGREETELFPLAERYLTGEDWAAIDGQVVSGEDPLFGTADEARYRALRESITRYYA